jgi:SAM-dependent methyltransferase
MDLSVRSTQPEELDDDTTDPAVYARCMSELGLINRLTLTHRPALRWLDKATTHLVPGDTFSVLDIGCGGGDLLRAIARWADRRGFTVKLSGIDLNPRSAKAALPLTPSRAWIDYITGDVFDYVPSPVDFIVSSQFTHHLTDDVVILFLQWIDTHASCGWHIADLHRHKAAYHGFPILCRLMGWHRIIREDGMISIARSFQRDDWDWYLWHASVDAKVRWHMGFRFCVSRIKSNRNSWTTFQPRS